MAFTKVIGADEIGTISCYEGDVGSFLYYVTPCCGADATGVSVTDDNPGGVACRACYRPVDPRLGGNPERSVTK